MNHGPGTVPERLGIVVVNYGSSALLRSNLTAVASAVPDAVVVVVDNWSTAVEREAIRRLTARRRWLGLYPGNNLGFGTGMNQGVAAARTAGATEFLLLNPDAVIDADAVSRLRAAVHCDPMSLVAPVVRRPDGTLWSAGSDLYLRSGTMRSRRRRAGDRGPTREWLSGACLMVGAGLWDLVGGFDDAYFLYWEDVDLSHRILDAGGTLLVLESATAVHDEGGTHRSEHQVGKSPTYYYWNARNRLRYAAEHLPVRDRLRWLALAPWAGREILLQGGRRQLLRPVPPVGAVIRGTAAGTAILIRSLLSGARSDTAMPGTSARV